MRAWADMETAKGPEGAVTRTAFAARAKPPRTRTEIILSCKWDWAMKWKGVLTLGEFQYV